MNLFHFTGRITAQGVTTADHTVTVQMDNVLHAALEAGHQIRAHFAAQGVTGYLAVERVEAPVACPVRQMGRKMGLTEAQIDQFIAAQS